MTHQPLAGKRVAIFVEHKFIPEEIEAYRTRFAELGAEVHFTSRLFYGDWRPASAVFYSDVDPSDNRPNDPPQALTVSYDVSHVEQHLDSYSAVVMAANYTSVRLRYDVLPKDRLADLTAADIAAFDPRAHVQSAPVVRLFAAAMARRDLVKGALCHGLWILAPNPHLLRGRRVICHSVVMADVLNAGATVELAPTGVVVDDDLVTGFSRHEVLPFIDAIAAQMVQRCGAGV